MTKKRQTRVSTEQNSTEGKHIPSDLLFNDILWRCPVKSLLRFRCVSKQWRHAISDPKFVQNHLNRSAFSGRRLLLVRATSDKEPNTIHYFTLDYQYCEDDGSDNGENVGHFFVQKLDSPWTGSTIGFSGVLGCCNGLLLSAIPINHPLLVWNPSTRTYWDIPCNHHYNHKCLLTGFCYDSSVDDYMAIFGRTDYNKHTSLLILSIRKYAVMGIYNQPYGIVRSEAQGVNFNGVSHWIMRRWKSRERVLVCYDFEGKSLKELPPPTKTFLHSLRFHLLVLMGCLCSYHYGVDGLLIWVMKEYFVGESWTCLYRISNLPCVPNGFHPKPLFLTKKGEIMVAVSQKELVIHNPMKKTSKICKINLPEASIEHVEAVFSDSLVVPAVAAKNHCEGEERVPFFRANDLVKIMRAGITIM